MITESLGRGTRYGRHDDTVVEKEDKAERYRRRREEIRKRDMENEGEGRDIIVQKGKAKIEKWRS